jgi:SAM-dependent methyltransferase
VTAIDLETRFLPDPPPANLEVRRQDIVDDPLETGAYDLIHARCLLEHLPSRDKVLGKLVDALKPGGRIVLADVDFAAAPAAVAYFHPAGKAPLHERGFAAVGAVFRSAGADPDYGRKLIPALFDHGLTDIGGALSGPIVAGGGTPDWIRMTLTALREPIVRAGLLTTAEIDEICAITADPDCRYVPVPLATAWGTRPNL